MSTVHPLADCCPRCWPGDNPASLPASVEPDRNDSLRATYQCTAGHTWTTWWDRQATEWPVIDRSAA